MNSSEISITISAIISSWANKLTDEEIRSLIAALYYSVDTLKVILELRKFDK